LIHGFIGPIALALPYGLFWTVGATGHLCDMVLPIIPVKHMPILFVMMTKREEHGYEKIPEIRDFVAANYTLLEEIDGVRICKGKEVQP